jgi:hypothetical protein
LEDEKASAEQGSDSQNFIFLTYKWIQLAGELHYTRLESLARDKHSSLLGPFEENEVF